MNKVDIYIHNDYFDIISNDLDSHDYNFLFEIAFYSLAHRRKILDYIFKAVLNSSYDDVLVFKRELIDCNLYDDYKKSILNGNDNFLKSCLVLYFEKDLKDQLYDSNMQLAKTIVESDEDVILKLSNLLNISQFICKQEEIDYIKNNMKSIAYDYCECEDDEYINKILKDNFDIFDNNQEALNEEIVYTYKR